MQRGDAALPPAAVVQAALRQTAERLALELACPSARAPDWNAFEWRVAMAVSVMHGISALLASQLRWSGPPHWQAFLAEQAEQGLLREHKTRDLLRRLDDAARRADLPLVAMKGSALLGLDLYAPGQRPMSDVDLLARPQDFEAAHRLVLAAGYAEGATTWKHRDYEPLDVPADRAFGEHVCNPIKIDLHTSVQERLPAREVGITAQVFAPAARPGLNVYPSQAALMRHLLLHAAGNLCAHGVRLIQLHDIVALAGRLNESEWDEALASASDGLPAWWAVPPLALAQRLFAQRWPGTAMGRAHDAALAACPPLLLRAAGRWRLDQVSLSGYRIPMLPGILWSRDAADALAYARMRLHPGHEAERQHRRSAGATHAFTASSWFDQPRWRKALRFVLGAPPRVPTLYSLHKALAYEPAHASSA